MSTELQHTHVGLWHAIIMQNDAMRVTVIPEIGGKIISLQSRRTEREWLWKNPYLPLRKPSSASTDFGAFDTGGWDEVFPTVNPCRVPHSAWGDRTLIDHGELWFRPWQILGAVVEPKAAAKVTLAVDEADLPFRFERTLTLADGLAPLTADYSVTNKSTLPMPFIWAAHPLLAIEPGDSFCIPEGTRLSSTGTIGLELATNVTEFAWPILPLASGDALDISHAPEPSARFAIKLFAENVPNGAIEIANHDQAEVLRLSLESLMSLHVGLWLNYGAWSGANTRPYYNAGVEPTNFPHDDLNAAVHSHNSALAPGSIRRWEFSISIKAKPASRQ
jgi:galactose mutarotase-like enzyme